MLLLLFLMPFIFAGMFLLVPRIWPSKERIISLILGSLPLALLIIDAKGLIGSKIQLAWLPHLGISFSLEIDALSYLFLFLTALVVPISLFTASEQERRRIFYVLVFLVEGLLFGLFMARDLFFFTVFWEAALLPLYFLIQLFGSGNKHVAALNFIIYMIAGSALMVLAVLALFVQAGSVGFQFDVLSAAASSAPYASAVFAIFLLAFAVKTPLFPFHGWLPAAYTQASTSGSILLAAVLSKAGIYGFLRIGGEFFPQIWLRWNPYLFGLAIIGVFYGAFLAWSETNFKRVIAYSSLSHVNFILAGLFVGQAAATSGGVLQAFNHGITITGLFFVSGLLEEKLGSKRMDQAGGLAAYFPRLCWLTLFFVLASMALPGMNNFVGEFLILFGLFMKSPWLAAFLSLSMIFSAVYMLRWMKKLYFGTPLRQDLFWRDIGIRELAVALPLIFLVLFAGLYPRPFLDIAASYEEKISQKTSMESIRSESL